ncbi:MAG TPA: hypothetical protein VNN21_11455 [Dehalococcoidia bacterium]|nr:hypothetical protein [Dehalococcoidia bacterium]
MQRLLKPVLSLVIVGAASVIAFASAARLNLNAQAIQAGNVVIQGCQGDVPVALNFDTEWQGPNAATLLLPGFVVKGVVISGINEQCDGHKMRVVLTFHDGSSEDLGEFTVASPNMEILLGDPKPLASDLTDAHVLIK